MRRFFGAWEAQFGRPLLNKNNSLNLCASLVAEALPRAHFLLVQRDPIFLAQSLLEARRFIHGSERIPYGLDDPQRPAAAVDPLADVCRQVRFHLERGRAECQKIGVERCWEVSYEAFCADPVTLVARVGREILGLDLDREALACRLPSLHPSRARRLSEESLRRLEEELSPLRSTGAGS